MSPGYHAWTHRPKALGGTDPIEIPGAHEYAYFIKTTNATLASGAGTITFFANDGSFSSDETCIHCNDDATYGGTFEILKTGIYVCSFGAAFTTTFAAEKKATIRWSFGMFNAPTLTPERSVYDSSISDSEATVFGGSIISNLNTAGSVPGLNYVECVVQQFSGSAKTIDSAGAFIVRIVPDV